VLLTDQIQQAWLMTTAIVVKKIRLDGHKEASWANSSAVEP
jgi:hypothetical protein